MSYPFEQLKSLLWATPDVHVYAFVRGEVIPDFRQRLSSAHVKDWDCLLRGALSVPEQASAPYVVDLVRESAFTDWLLTQAHSAYPQWGFLGLGAASFLDVRELGRGLMQVCLPGGQLASWNWTDPLLWFGLLPQLNEHQLHTAFGGLGLSDWVQVTQPQWRWHTLSAGQLSVTARDCVMD